MKIKDQIRQGDVLVEQAEINVVDSTHPKGAVILAHGEVTGHCHEIDAPEAVEHWGDEVNNSQLSTRIMVLTGPVSLTHQEHSRIPLSPGTKRVIRQREYSPAAIRNVAD